MITFKNKIFVKKNNLNICLRDRWISIGKLEQNITKCGMEMKINIEGSITTTSKTYKCVVNYSLTPPRIIDFRFMILLFYFKSHA